MPSRQPADAGATNIAYCWNAERRPASNCILQSSNWVMSPFQTFSTRMVRSVSLSTQTKHLEFEVAGVPRFGFVAASAYISPHARRPMKTNTRRPTGPLFGFDANHSGFASLCRGRTLYSMRQRGLGRCDRCRPSMRCSGPW